MPAWARTWIEHWPEGLAELSFAQRAVPLTVAQAHALGRRNGVLTAAFRAGDDAEEALARLGTAIDRELPALGGSAFARLGSRSAKDTPLGVITGSRVDSGAEALRLLTDGSHRLAKDLHRALAHRLTPHVYLRRWHEIDDGCEFRCFLRDGRLAGVSQYHARQPLPEGVSHALPRIHRQIARLMERVLRTWGTEPVVADVLATPEGETTLIELNPWGPPTDAVLFSWAVDGFDGSLRVFRQATDGWDPAAAASMDQAVRPCLAGDTGRSASPRSPLPS